MKLTFLFLIALSTVSKPSNAASASMGKETFVGSTIDSAVVPVPKEELKNMNAMKKDDLNMNQSTPVMPSAKQPTSLVSRVNQLEAEFREKIEEIQIEARRNIEDQYEKFAIIRAREQNFTKLLNQNRKEIEVLKTMNRDQSKKINQLEQKWMNLPNMPLAPSHLERASYKDETKNKPSSVDSPISSGLLLPSSCQDLEKLQHSLDGIYLVKHQETKKIQTIFCQFKGSKIFQELIGNVDIKTKTIHFYVQRNASFAAGGKIPFEFARLNEGGAMNLTTGIFTALVPGIYHFELSGLKEQIAPFLSVYLQLNGANVGKAYISSSIANRDSLSIQASLRLRVNDKVNLFNEDGRFYDSPNHLTHFTGWLLDEDLI